jgi:hypothetical protein
MPSTYTPIATTTLGTNQANAYLVFSSIPSTYTDLRLIISTRSTNASATDDIYLRFNGSGSGYSWTYLHGNGSSASSSRASSQNVALLGFGVAAASAASGIFDPIISDINNYSNTTTNKTMLSRYSTQGFAGAAVSLWQSTTAIDSITLYWNSGQSFASGSTFTLYGVKSA